MQTKAIRTFLPSSLSPSLPLSLLPPSCLLILVAAERFPLSEHEGLVLHRLVQGDYTSGMAPLLQTNTDVWQLFIQLLGTSPPASLTTPSPQELALLQVKGDIPQTQD